MVQITCNCKKLSLGLLYLLLGVYTQTYADEWSSQTIQVHAQEGTDVTIQCNVTESPDIQVWWTKTLTSEEVWEYGTNLTIPNINRTEAGLYVCHAGNLSMENTSQIVEQVDIDVTYPTKVLEMTISTHIVLENEPFTVTCTVEGNPPPAFTIFLNNTGWVFNTTDTGYQLQAFVPHSLCEDYGTYICAGNNSLNDENATASQSIAVLCAPKPDIRFGVITYDRSAYRGLPFDLIMSALGDPTPSFNWTKDGGEASDAMVTTVNSTSFLHIENVTIDDFGVYSVTMENKYGSYVANFTLRGREAPEQPLDFRVLNVSTDRVSLAWESGFDFGYLQMFYVMRKISDDLGYIECGRFNDTSTNHGRENVSHVVRFLDPSTEYDMLVMSHNHNGFSNTSNKVVFTTTGQLPEKQISSKTGVIVGSIFGSLAFVALVVAVVWLMRRRNTRRTSYNTIG